MRAGAGRVVAGCLALAALSLLLGGAPTYDPWSWLIWGREIASGELTTTGGPSWKPLPVLFTTPFSLFGDAAPALWLVVARAGALLGAAMGFRLAARLAGPVAGVVAAAAILVSETYAVTAWRGSSEGLLVGLCLWAVERHLAGRRGAAFALGFAAALLRPEIWALWGLYGLHAAWREPRLRAWVASAFAGVPVAWFVPELLGSGDLLRAASRARQPNLSSAAYADFPALRVLELALPTLPLVVAAGALVAVVAAARRRAGDHDHVVLVLAGAAVALLAAVAGMAQIGFSGNLRYVVLPMAFIAVLAGAGWVEAVRTAARRSRAAGAALVVLGLAGAVHAGTVVAPDLRAQQERSAREVRAAADLPRLVERLGGAARVRACGDVYTTRFSLPLVAWTLHARLDEVGIFPLPPGVVLAPRGSAAAKDPRFARAGATEHWGARRACG